jgi:hypothetical protein
MSRKTCVRCGLAEPEVNFLVKEYLWKGKLVRCEPKVCAACTGKAVSGVRRAAIAAKLECPPARKRCATCGEEKPNDDAHFYEIIVRSKLGDRRQLSGVCIDCRCGAIRRYRKTAKFQRYLAENRSRIRKLARKNARKNYDPERERRRVEREREEDPLAGKMRNILGTEVKFGRVVKSERCEECRLPFSEEERKPKAFFYDGREKPLHVVWLCYPCHSRVSKQRTSIYCSREEWEAHRVECEAEVERDGPGPWFDPKDGRELVLGVWVPKVRP